MRKFLLYTAMVLMFAGCRKHEDDLRTYFYEHRNEFEYLRNAEFSNSSDNMQVEELKETLGVFMINRFTGGCDTILDNYEETRFKMRDDVHSDDTPWWKWGSSYSYVYSVCPQDSFHYVSNNVTQVWLAPHWCYFIEKEM